MIIALSVLPSKKIFLNQLASNKNNHKTTFVFDNKTTLVFNGFISQ